MGKDGFEKIVAEVAGLEKQLAFTTSPGLPRRFNRRITPGDYFGMGSGPGPELDPKLGVRESGGGLAALPGCRRS